VSRRGRTLQPAQFIAVAIDRLKGFGKPASDIEEPRPTHCRPAGCGVTWDRNACGRRLQELLESSVAEGAGKTRHRQRSFWPGGAAIHRNAFGEMHSLLAYKQKRLASYACCRCLGSLLKASKHAETNLPPETAKLTPTGEICQHYHGVRATTGYRGGQTEVTDSNYEGVWESLSRSWQRLLIFSAAQGKAGDRGRLNRYVGPPLVGFGDTIVHPG
jgi:hypothetical protein